MTINSDATVPCIDATREVGGRNTPRVSVIVPARNEARNIGRCLQSLAEQDIGRNRFEVIVIDNESTDSTVEIARSYGAKLELSVISNAEGYISALRNLGAKKARSEVLAFLDADCAAPSTWLSDALRLASPPATGVVGSHYCIPERSSWSARIWDRYHGSFKQGEVAYVPAGDMIMPRRAFRLVGGFDETIQTNEDAELCARVRNAGLPVCAYHELGVVHFGTPQSLTAFYRKQRWHGTHVFRVFLRNKGHQNVKVTLFALLILGCEVGAEVGLALLALTRNWYLLALCLVLLGAIACGSALSRAMSRRRWKGLPGLSLLYITYGLARAHCIADFRNWTGSNT